MATFLTWWDVTQSGLQKTSEGLYKGFQIVLSIQYYKYTKESPWMWASRYFSQKSHPD